MSENAEKVEAGLPDTLSCWIVSDGKAGIEGPCLGLAEALGVEPEVKRIDVRAPWRWLPPNLWPAALSAPGPAGDRLSPPWPDLVIANGRKAMAPAAAIRRASGGRAFVVVLQAPQMRLDAFDLVIAPKHDRLEGANVFSVQGSITRIRPETLSEEAERFAGELKPLPRPRVAVLIGGTSKVHRMDMESACNLAEGLARMAREEGCGLMITASRRTGKEAFALIREALADLPAVLWDGTGPNPYFAYLGAADAIVVTEDSVNMVSEAATTGKPVLVAALSGGSAKFRRFHADMAAAGITRPFHGRLDEWSYTPLDEAGRAAAEVARRLAQRGQTVRR
ncbi:MAG: mitochondrial fission ELM1 family protein [Rhodovibrionaceae bacterium]|nr:mitochondrial fission ELM1 family protein [Rhodovibrionaceae bacterium]